MTDKPLSHSKGKPKYVDIFEWLDKDFLLEMSSGMSKPVKMGKYPKNNWKTTQNNRDFYLERVNSALRHLIEIIDGNTIDQETMVHHLAMVANNCMMCYYHKEGKEHDCY